jgi:predicted nucleic acid-binding protein
MSDLIKREYVLDSSVFLAAFDKTSPDMDKAQKFLHELEKREFMAQMPAHAWFEVLCTWKRMQMEKVFVAPKFASGNAYPIKFIHIDEDFLKKYGNIVDLPYIKGADHIFLVYSKVNDIPLVTRDKKLFQAARTCGARVFTPDEYMERVGVGSKFDPWEMK